MGWDLIIFTTFRPFLSELLSDTIAPIRVSTGPSVDVYATAVQWAAHVTAEGPNVWGSVLPVFQRVLWASQDVQNQVLSVFGVPDREVSELPVMMSLASR